jgi:hypothetical protein
MGWNSVTTFFDQIASGHDERPFLTLVVVTSLALMVLVIAASAFLESHFRAARN